MKKAILIGVAVGVVIFGAINAFAAPYINDKLVVVNQVYVVNPAMSAKMSRRAAQQVINRQRAKDRIRVRLSKQVIVDDPFVEQRLDPVNTKNRFREEFDYWNKRLVKDGRGTSILVSAPAWTLDNQYDAQGWPSGGSPYLGGFASTGSVLWGGFAYGTAISVGYGGANKFHQSKLIMDHELKHTYGASHDNSGPNGMHEDAQSYLKELKAFTLPTTQKTLDEIKAVLRGL